MGSNSPERRSFLHWPRPTPSSLFPVFERAAFRVAVVTGRTVPEVRGVVYEQFVEACRRYSWWTGVGLGIAPEPHVYINTVRWSVNKIKRSAQHDARGEVDLDAAETRMKPPGVDAQADATRETQRRALLEACRNDQERMIITMMLRGLSIREIAVSLRAGRKRVARVFYRIAADAVAGSAANQGAWMTPHDRSRSGPTNHSPTTVRLRLANASRPSGSATRSRRASGT